MSNRFENKVDFFVKIDLMSVGRISARGCEGCC